MKKISLWWDKLKKKGQESVDKIKAFRFKKIFKKKNKVKEVDVEVINTSTIKERKKRKSFLPSLVILGSKKTKRLGLILIPSVIAITGLGIGLSFIDDGNKIEKEVVLETSKTYHRVYLLSNDDYVVPLSVKMEKRSTTQEEILEVFACLKTNSKVANKHLHGYIPENTKINELTIVDNMLTLDMSEEFLTYSETNELKMVESLVYTFLDFENINALSLKVEGKVLNQMPKGNLVINNPLTLEMGINKPTISPIETLSKSASVVYYEKQYGDQKYYVPLTVMSEKQDSPIKAFYEATKIKPSIVSGFKRIMTYNQIDHSVEPLINEQDVVIGLTDQALMDEGVIKEDIYELLLLSFSLMGIDQNVSLQVNGESYEVNGYAYEDATPVNSITYNIVAITSTKFDKN